VALKAEFARTEKIGGFTCNDLQARYSQSWGGFFPHDILASAFVFDFLLLFLFFVFGFFSFSFAAFLAPRICFISRKTRGFCFWK
jgi:hypothetical protein